MLILGDQRWGGAKAGNASTSYSGASQLLMRSGFRKLQTGLVELAGLFSEAFDDSIGPMLLFALVHEDPR